MNGPWPWQIALFFFVMGYIVCELVKFFVRRHKFDKVVRAAEGSEWRSHTGALASFPPDYKPPEPIKIGDAVTLDFSALKKKRKTLTPKRKPTTKPKGRA